MSRRSCVTCDSNLSWEVYNYSNKVFNAPLCRAHQDWLRNIESTDETIDFYLALRKRGVPAEIEKFDGFKHIDIAIPSARVNIEIDGRHHSTDPVQAMADLKRTGNSFLKGYTTIRIPNVLIRTDLERAADYIAELLGQ